jgi:hypothetical protein
VTRQLLPIAGLALLATLVLLVALIVLPERRELLLDVYILTVGGVALARLVALTTVKRSPGERSEFDEALRPHRGEPIRVAELDRLERELDLGRQTAFDFHFRLRPTLVEIANRRLAARGISLADEERARALLGAETWELLTPEAALPANRHAPGPSLAELRGVVGALERI